LGETVEAAEVTSVSDADAQVAHHAPMRIREQVGGRIAQRIGHGWRFELAGSRRVGVGRWSIRLRDNIHTAALFQLDVEVVTLVRASLDALLEAFGAFE